MDVFSAFRFLLLAGNQPRSLLVYEVSVTYSAIMSCTSVTHRDCKYCRFESVMLFFTKLGSTILNKIFGSWDLKSGRTVYRGRIRIHIRSSAW